MEFALILRGVVDVRITIKWSENLTSSSSKSCDFKSASSELVRIAAASENIKPEII